ncbi:type II toxin-antitoxin system HipA family toxin [Desulfurispira natronophila]|uniref:Serine/threonine-protein kinase HipA n=1 Tax=Desulfurispira natronophila TaxID=682562 RepID=A0A7W8DGC4_9BACT|nr:type II toxin-antitoxin system HipA family toxin [Desulfurispira natronophila]MBB5021346.1 serine/threonine-protein kinase HipA [Desulfurispira natronophila]
MTARSAQVWWQDRNVGTIREDERGIIHFRYSDEWLHRDDFPVSISLPLHKADQELEAHSFFAGLLPEGATRQRICRQQGINQSDDMGLLLAIGEDCAGALSVLPPDIRPELGSSTPVALPQEDFERLLRKKGQVQGTAVASAQRFSLAGAQDKLPVIRRQEQLFLPDAHHPSSHIIKFETLNRVCFAEYMAGRIAHSIGLPVVSTSYRTTVVGKSTLQWLEVERYDRVKDSKGRLVRLHQEDILQALGMPVSMKYQSDGGPSIAQIGELLRQHLDRPAIALSQLRDWQICNFLIGNWDGHAKNLALLYTPGSAAPTLAPFYDLVAIEFLNQLTPGSYARDMALFVGSEKNPERITKAQWEEMARQLSMPPKPLLQRVRELAEQLPGIATACREEFAREHGDRALYDKLVGMVRKRSRWTLKTMAG